MKVLEVVHSRINYRFEYLEQSKVIEVVKADVPTYKIKVKLAGDSYAFECDCPGSVWHEHCWHVDGDIDKGGFYPGALDILFQPTINEPWAEWAEEAGRMKYDNHERH